ncbi:hypothetical protein BU24DRAFT_424525 [Aaosphaeria arxii CBS 175.79]|uniref:Uncharacterized protein n=1 Tax=Aaosphaeria arxii CBS 175.79 TaxID=1450172 RepID=A0A6A5XKZ3_9PLEO|nr:uncharacterized protein BU24DRAFT_424525 [Aaosphaeria arxii CBS 175.79]KAF2013519.1 hypothetical protein BU24DRAFT_424525 [Aaosphaeria arxii CBS 175.79]
MPEPTSAPIHSTGRGGAGNIGPDSTVYTDGGIVREGIVGESVDGPYSTGRGGAGNVGASPSLQPTRPEGRRSIDYIPENALRPHEENYHTGRGGSGNVHREGSHSPNLAAQQDKKGLGDKIKHVLHLDKDKGEKKAEGSPLVNESKG